MFHSPGCTKDEGRLEDHNSHERMARGNSRTSSSSSGTSRRGFAAMDPAKQRKIAAMGGRASHGGRSGSRSSNY